MRARVRTSAHVRMNARGRARTSARTSARAREENKKDARVLSERARVISVFFELGIASREDVLAPRLSWRRRKSFLLTFFPVTTRIKKKDALLKLMIKPFQEMKNKKLKKHLKALEKSFHLGAIPLF